FIPASGSRRRHEHAGHEAPDGSIPVWTKSSVQFGDGLIETFQSKHLLLMEVFGNFAPRFELFYNRIQSTRGDTAIGRQHSCRADHSVQQLLVEGSPTKPFPTPVIGEIYLAYCRCVLGIAGEA